MRPIKFRGKSKETGEWVYGNFITLKHGTGSFILSQDADMYLSNNVLGGQSDSSFGIPDFSWNIEPSDITEVDPKTVGQYTGCKDKNDQEIYEGDIIRELITKISKDSYSDYKVIFEDGGFRTSCLPESRRDGTPLGWIPPSCIEIIGNIHDNPELLEK